MSHRKRRSRTLAEYRNRYVKACVENAIKGKRGKKREKAARKARQKALAKSEPAYQIAKILETTLSLAMPWLNRGNCVIKEGRELIRELAWTKALELVEKHPNSGL